MTELRVCMCRDRYTVGSCCYLTKPDEMLCCLVPGGGEGPSGVMICSENYLTYKNFGDQPDIRCPIPRRRVRSLTVFLMCHLLMSYDSNTVISFAEFQCGHIVYCV